MGGSSPPKTMISQFKSKRFLQAENDIEILHGSARSTFAEIVVSRYEEYAVVVAENGDLHTVLSRKSRAGEEAFLRHIVYVGNDGSSVQAPINLRKSRGRSTADILLEERHRHDHSAVKIGYDRTEDRRGRESCDRLHFLQMLVLLCQTVLTGRAEQGISSLGFVFSDHFFTAAAVARDGMTGQARRGGKNAAFDQGMYECDKAAGMTAGNGDPF